MLVISRYKINQMQGIIPNLASKPDFTLEISEAASHKILMYKWRDRLLLRLHDYNGDIRGTAIATEVALASGLFIRCPNDWQGIYDALYYHCNEYPLNLENKSLAQLSKLVKRLRTRLNKSWLSHRQSFTNKVINELVDFVVRRQSIPLPERNLASIKDYIEAVRYGICSVTGENCPDIKFDVKSFKWYDSTILHNFRTYYGMFSKFPDENDLSEFNLVLTPSLPSYQAMWINPETEVIDNNTIYLRSEVQLHTCPSCQRQVRAHSLIEGIGCTHCAKQKAKIHSYSTKVPDLLKFKATKVKPNTLYLGVELEYESNDSNKLKDAIYTNEILKNHAILKSDGSVRTGFEIVSCPATIDIHLVEFKKFFIEYKEKTKLHAESNTGMHVHISRKPLNMLTIGKMTAFLNNKANKPFIERIAGRKLNHYCNQDENRTISYPLVYGSGDRYNTLNLRNEQTVEIRIFSTPESYEEFAYKLEFSQALSEYCSPCAANYSVYDLIKASNFASWVLSKRKVYPYLSAKLKQSV